MYTNVFSQHATSMMGYFKAHGNIPPMHVMCHVMPWLPSPSILDLHGTGNEEASAKDGAEVGERGSRPIALLRCVHVAVIVREGRPNAAFPRPTD